MNVEINGLRLHVLEAGQRAAPPGAPPLVLLHAFPLSSAMWVPQIEALRHAWRILAPDVRGLGQSEAGDGQHPLEFFVDDLLALLDHLCVERAVLCGLSMGGYIALRLHERAPERVAALVLADTRSEADTDEAKLRRAAAIRSVKTDGVAAFAKRFLPTALAPATLASRPELVAEAERLISANSPRGIAGALLALATRTDTTASLSRIGVPTLLLVGEDDALTPPSLMQAMHRRIPGAVMHCIPAAGHLSNMENPEEFNRRLGAFLDSLR